MEVLGFLKRSKANILAVNLIFSVERNKSTVKLMSITGCTTSSFFQAWYCLVLNWSVFLKTCFWWVKMFLKLILWESLVCKSLEKPSYLAEIESTTDLGECRISPGSLAHRKRRSGRDLPSPEMRSPGTVSSCYIWCYSEVCVPCSHAHLPMGLLFWWLKSSSASLAIVIHFQIKPATLQSIFGLSTLLVVPFPFWTIVILSVLLYWIKPFRNRWLYWWVVAPNRLLQTPLPRQRMTD